MYWSEKEADHTLLNFTNKSYSLRQWTQQPKARFILPKNIWELHSSVSNVQKILTKDPLNTKSINKKEKEPINPTASSRYLLRIENQRLFNRRSLGCKSRYFQRAHVRMYEEPLLHNHEWHVENLTYLNLRHRRHDFFLFSKPSGFLFLISCQKFKED
jgi:hypothetical protein